MDRHWYQNTKMLVKQVQIPLEANFFDQINLPFEHYEVIQSRQHCQLCVLRENSKSINEVNVHARHDTSFTYTIAQLVLR